MRPLSGEVVAVRDQPGGAVTLQQARDEYLPPSARELIVKGMNPNTLAAYVHAWRPFRLWCEEERRTYAPASQRTMIAYLDSWRRLPVHVRCTCRQHRPSPSSMWIWYSAVKFYHGVGEPPLPWECGRLLEKAMIGYSTEMVDAGWEPRKAPRAYPEHVKAMVDALDPSAPKHLRDRAVILTNFYTASRASDLATYRIGDVARTPRGVDLTLRQSKTNKQVGRKVEMRPLFANTAHPQYCAVAALDTWLAYLTERGITNGALFRPFNRWGKLQRGAADALGYRMDGTTLSEVIREAAIRAGVPGAEDFTCHSNRRGRATDLREKGVDALDIARAYGWVPGGAINVYLEEAERWAPTAPGAVGLL